MASDPLRFYADLARWWPLLSPVEDYDEEAFFIVSALQQGIDGAFRSLLELGSGAGHHAVHLPAELEVVLTDISPEMLELSRRVNPDREHLRRDMRTLRLERHFDAVLLHDAVMYLPTEADLRETLRAIKRHLRPGGAALIVPDAVKDTWKEGLVSCGGHDGEDAVQLAEWHWDPDPDDDSVRLELALMIREGGTVRVEHEAHTLGLFSRAQWREILLSEGFEIQRAQVPGFERRLHFLLRLAPSTAPPE